MFKSVFAVLVVLFAVTFAQVSVACLKDSCDQVPKPKVEATCAATFSCVLQGDKCGWAVQCPCNCSADKLQSGCLCVSTTSLNGVQTCTWAQCPPQCAMDAPANTGECICSSTGEWKCSGCMVADKPDKDDCYCSGSSWVCPVTPTEPIAEGVCGQSTKPPASDCKCDCISTEDVTIHPICSWNCPSRCEALYPSRQCPCYESLNGWSYACPVTPAPSPSPTVVPPPAVIPSPCFATEIDVSSCECVCELNSETNTRSCNYVCGPSRCPQVSGVDTSKCRCLLASSDVDSAGNVEATYKWHCPPPPTPSDMIPPPDVIIPTPVCMTPPDNSDCVCRCASITSADNITKRLCDWSCPTPRTCLGLPPAASCVCRSRPQLQENTDSLYYWDCPPVSPCEGNPPSEKCQCDVVGIRSDGTRKFDWLCPTCTGTPPRSDCKCTSTFANNAGELAGWTWVCPVSCSGAAPHSDCYCGFNPDSKAPSWICPKPRCDSTTFKEGCYCSRNSDGGFGWICPPRTCNSTFVYPANLNCPQAAATARCDPATGIWSFTCPPRACTCDGIPLPTLVPEKDGCSTKEAEWTCQQLADEVVGANAMTSNDIYDATKPRTCANWVYKCPRTIKPPEPVCSMEYVCGNLQCVDANFGVIRPICPAVERRFDCPSYCAKMYGTCTSNSVSGVKGCSFQYGVEYETCLKKCAASNTPIDPVPEDKCSHIADKCKCVNTRECGWCHRTVTSASSVIESGRCIRVSSNATCLTSTRQTSFTTSTDGCAVVVDPVIPIPVLPEVPSATDIRNCVKDTRCLNAVDVSKRIAKERDTAEPSSPIYEYDVEVETVVPEDNTSDDVSVSAVVHVRGERVPSPSDRVKICPIVMQNVLSSIKVDRNRGRQCVMTAATATPDKKRQADVGTEYVVEFQVASPMVGSSATSVVVAMASLVAALAVLFF